MSWRRRITRFYRPGDAWVYSGEAAFVVPEPQPRRPLIRLVLYAMIVAIALIMAATMYAKAQSDCVRRWNAVLYRPDDVSAFIQCVRGETLPVR